MQLAPRHRGLGLPGTFLSIDGRTNGMFMAMWGVLGVVWIKLPAVDAQAGELIRGGTGYAVTVCVLP